MKLNLNKDNKKIEFKMTQFKASILMMGLPLLSLFLWAGFDITWWVDAPHGSGREFVLVVLHIISIVIGYLMWLWSDEK